MDACRPRLAAGPSARPAGRAARRRCASSTPSCSGWAVPPGPPGVGASGRSHCCSLHERLPASAANARSRLLAGRIGGSIAPGRRGCCARPGHTPPRRGRCSGRPGGEVELAGVGQHPDIQGHVAHNRHYREQLQQPRPGQVQRHRRHRDVVTVRFTNHLSPLGRTLRLGQRPLQLEPMHSEGWPTSTRRGSLGRRSVDRLSARPVAHSPRMLDGPIRQATTDSAAPCDTRQAAVPLTDDWLSGASTSPHILPPRCTEFAPEAPLSRWPIADASHCAALRWTRNRPMDAPMETPSPAQPNRLSMQPAGAQITPLLMSADSAVCPVAARRHRSNGAGSSASPAS